MSVIPCEKCGGIGKLKVTRPNRSFFEVPCPSCAGSGRDMASAGSQGPYPVIICQARYGGTYEGRPHTKESAEWVGFIADDFPPDAFGADPACANWWNKWRDDGRVAVGESPEAVWNIFCDRFPAESWHTHSYPGGLPPEAFEESGL